MNFIAAPSLAITSLTVIGPGFLPLLLLGLVTCALRCGRPNGESTLREDLVRSALFLGVWLDIGTESLGHFHALSSAGVLGLWLAGLTVAGLGLAWRWRRAGPPAPIRLARPDRGTLVLVGGIAAVALVTLVVAWLSPPQSSDSVSYHMGRVMHWIQNRSLDPYPTYDSRQLFDPPFAEMIRLHLFLLTGGDRTGCLLQWFAAMGSLFAASLVARDLGGSGRAQVMAAAFAVTIPIGVAQATSGKNDWVEAFWLLALVHFSGAVSPRRRNGPTPGAVVSAAGALGLALATKLAAWFFAAPILVAAMVRTPRSMLRRRLAPAALGVVLVAGLITPFLRRNFIVYGSPIADPSARAHFALKSVTPATVLSNAMRNAMFQMGTRSDRVNAGLLKLVVLAHRIMGLDPSDPRSSVGQFTIPRPSLVEETVGSPIHILLIFSVALALVVSRVRRSDSIRILNFACLLAGYLLFCAAIKWQHPNARLLLPLLVLAAPLVAVVTTDVLGRRGTVWLAVLLFFGCVRIAFRTYARPLSFEPGRGILAVSRDDLYFARDPGLRTTLAQVADRLRASGVRNLGVVYNDSLQPEYLLWVSLKGMTPPLRIENVAVMDRSAAMANQPPFAGFRPDVIVDFASDLAHPRFPREFVVGAKYRFTSATGSAAFYSATSLSRPAAAGNRP